MDAANNLLRYSNDDGKTWHGIVIPEGSYELDDISKSVEHQMKQKNHYNNQHNKSFITLFGNMSTLNYSLKYQADIRSTSDLIGSDHYWVSRIKYMQATMSWRILLTF